MGRGDRRTRKGKITRNSYGNSRPKPGVIAKAKKEAGQAAKKETAKPAEKAE